MNITLRNVKNLVGLSKKSICYTASIYYNNARVGAARNAGDGTETLINVANRTYLEDMEFWCDCQDPIPSGVNGVAPTAMCLEVHIDRLVANFVAYKRLDQVCKKKTLYRLHSTAYAAHSYDAIDRPFSPATARGLRERHGSNLQTILNEEIAAAGLRTAQQKALDKQNLLYGNASNGNPSAMARVVMDIASNVAGF